MSIASTLTTERSDITSRRERVRQTERSVIDVRFLHKTISERVDRLARSAPTARSDDELAGHLARVLERSASRRPLDDLRGLAADPRAFGQKVLARWAELADGVQPGDEDLSVQRIGFDAETVSNGGGVDFRTESHPFLTVFAAFLRGDAGTAAVESAYRRNTRPLASAQTLKRSLLGLVGVLQDALEQHRDRLLEHRSEHVETLEKAWEQGVDPLEALKWETPVALLPVRLETRFTKDKSRLKVRVYPDQIHVDAHEEPLTEAEQRWGEAFWTQLWFASLPTNPSGAPPESAQDVFQNPSNLPDERSRTVARNLFQQYGSDLSTDPGTRFDEIRERAWAQGTERFGTERAAHVIHALSPVKKQDVDVGTRILEGWSNGTAPLPSVVELEFPVVDLRPASWTQVPRAQLLPDRFVGYAFYPADDTQDTTTSWSQRDDGSWKRRVGTEYVIRFTGRALAEPLPVGPSPEVVAREDEPSRFDWMTDFSRAKNAGMGLVVDVPTDADFQAAGAFSRVLVTGVRTSMSARDTAEALEDQIDAAHYTHGVELLDSGTPTNNADEPSGQTGRPDPAETVEIEAGPPLVEPGSDGERLADALGVRREAFNHVGGAGDTLDADAQAVNTVLWPATLGYFAANLWVDDDSPVRLDNGPPGSGGILSVASSGWEVAEEADIEYRSALRWIESYRRHFAEYVRGDGPFPSLRVGEQPYGLLPATPFDVASHTVPPADAEGVESASKTKYATVPPMEDHRFLPELVERIQALAPIWTRSASSVPSVATDAALSEEELLDLLAREPLAQSYHRRMWLMDDTHPILSTLGLPGSTPEKTDAVLQALTDAGVKPSWLPRIAELTHLGISLDGDDVSVRGDLHVQARILLFGIAVASSFDLFQRLKDVREGEPLQEKILRLSVLQAALASRMRVGAAYGDPANLPPERAEFPLDPSAPRSGLSETLGVLEDTIPGTAPSSGVALTQHAEVTGESSYEDLLLEAVARDVQSDVPPSQSPDPAFARYLTALSRLDDVDPDRLDRAFRSTMDLASHRLDAWWTSVATRRLSTIRERQSGSSYEISPPRTVDLGSFDVGRVDIGGFDVGGFDVAGLDRGGIHVGAFGFVEDLSPGSGPDAEYLLAPSTDQAQTAAVLRAAHKGRAQQNHAAASSLAVDLSAEQVRRARALLRGVRGGQTLAELLGYRFERLLREKSTSNHPLERYIHDYRALASAVQGRLGHEDTEKEAQKNEAKKSDVVDGRALYREWTNDALNDDFVDSADRSKIDAIFREIGRSVDAVQDVLLAESVHHLIHGRPERSAAALEALSRGQAVPQELQVIETPRTETNVTHRLAALSGKPGSSSPPSDWQAPGPPVLSANQILGSSGFSPVPIQVRDDAEPTLNAWLGSMLPGPQDVGCAGEFRWSRERSFATGTLTVPKTSGPVTVQDVGFRPDVVELSVVLGAEADEPMAPTVFGEGHGVYRCAAGGIPEKEQAVFAAVESVGAETTGETGTSCLLVQSPGASSPLRATMGRLRDDGFELNVQSVGTAAGSVVHYRAYHLADPTSVRVGTVSVPANASTKQIDLSGGVGDDFDPDHVAFRSVVPSGSGRVGVSRGDVVRQASGRDVLATAVEVDASGASNRVAARDDAAIYATDSTGGQGMTAAVAAFPEGDSNIELRFEAPQGGSYTAGRATYVATESPVSDVDEPSGPTVHRPAVGHVAGPSAEGESVDVTLGFKPGLIEISVATALTDDGSGLPASADPTAEQSGVAAGIAADAVDQASVSSGRAGGGFSALSSTSRIAVLLTEDSDGNPVAATSIRLAEVHEDGFTLRFPSLDSDHENLRVFYRARPAEPSEQTFTAATSVALSDLNLSPLDAVALTQGSEKEGDSQLERRIGYHCFRHAPSTRPPVPDDATLRLTFRDAGGADVSIADFVEMATTARDVIGEGRPADAQDLVHPGDEGDPGYTSETKTRLTSRANTVRTAAKRTRNLLKHRLILLEARPNVCTQVDDVVQALREAVAAVPFQQIIDVCTALSQDHPGGSTNDIQKTILGELGEIAKRLRAGPIGEGVSAEVHPPAGGAETIRLSTEIPEGVPVKIVFRSFADAVRFPQQTATATTQADGMVSVVVNTRDLAPGTAFTATVIPQASGAETLTDVLFRRMENRSPDVWEDVLAQLEEEGFLEDHDAEVVENVADVSPELRRHVWAALRREGKIRALTMIDATDVIERWNDVDQTLTDIIIEVIAGLEIEEQKEHLRELHEAGLLDDRQERRVRRYPERDGGKQRHLWASLSKEARIAFLENVGEEERADRYRSGDPAGPEVHEGRVADHPDGGHWQDLQRYLEEEAQFVPALLWLHRVREKLTGKEVEALTRAIQSADEGRIQDEVDMMTHLPGLYGSGSTETRAFTSDHLEAAKAVRDLLDLDLSRLVSRLDEAVRPLRWSGLTDLLVVTGDRFRPDEQRFWRDPDGSPDMIVEKFPEAEVRSRVARTVGAPRFDVPGAFGGYSLPVRDFLLHDSVPSRRVEFLRSLENLLRSPAAAVRTLDPVLADARRFVHDLHDVLHHVDAYLDDHSVSDLDAAVTDLAQAIDQGELTAEDLEDAVREPRALLQSWGNLAPKLLDAVRSYASGSVTPANRRTTFLDDVDQTLSNLKDAAHQQIETLILGAAAQSRPARAFCAGVLESLRQVLLRASYFGIYGSTPASSSGGAPEDETTLVEQARAAFDELNARLKRAKAAAASTVDAQVDRLQELLGDGFTVLPPFAPVNPGEVHDTFSRQQALLDGDTYAPDTWLQRIARIREQPKSFQQLRTYADALGFATGNGTGGALRRTLTVGQLPHQAGEDWLGRDDVQPSGGEVVFGVDVIDAYADGTPLPPPPGASGSSSTTPLIAGLFIDEWVEAIPADEETIGMGLQYDDPSTRAPQTALLAVPPAWRHVENEGLEYLGPTYWTDDLLRQTITETLAWMRRRRVDAEALETLGHVLPALYFPYNADAYFGATLSNTPTIELDELDWL